MTCCRVDLRLVFSYSRRCWCKDHLLQKALEFFTLRAQTCKEDGNRVKMESCERFWAFWTSFWEVFLWSFAQFQVGSRYSSRHDSAECAICCHRKWTWQREQKGWKKSRQQLQVGVWANRYQWIYKPLAFGPFLSRVLLGFIGVYKTGPLQQMDFGRLMERFSTSGWVCPKIAGEKGSVFVSSLEPLGVYFRVPCSFSEGVHDFWFVFFSLPDSRLFSAAQSTWRKHIFVFSERFVNKEPFWQELPSSKLTWQQKVDLEWRCIC